MESLPNEHWPMAANHLGHGRAAHLFGPHMVSLGRGEWWTDRWPDPRASALFVGGNLAIEGDASCLVAAEVAAVVSDRLQEWDRIFLEVTGPCEALVLGAFDSLQHWPRILFGHRGPAPAIAAPAGAHIRRLGSADRSALEGLDPALQWFSDPWGGAAACLAGGRAWGAWCRGTLASVAGVGFLGRRFDELFVVTESEFRGRGLSPVCAARVIEDSYRAGSAVGWTTWPANTASRRVAAKLGFSPVGESHAWIAGDRL